MSTLLLRMLLFPVGLLSWQQVQQIGALLGRLWFHLVRIRRKTVLNNLALALPKQQDDHFDIARNAYSHFGISAMEFLKLRQMTNEQISARVHVHGAANYNAALARGAGVIVVTAHYGNFDLLACSQAASGAPLAIVSRELHHSGISRFWMETRHRCGLEIFPDKGAAKRILKWLRQGNVLGLTVDQRTPPTRGGIRSPFMGQMAWTTTAPAMLAMRTGAPLLPVRIDRRWDGDHDIYIEPAIDTSTLKNGDDIRAWVNEINEIVGAWVARRPDHWMWLHRRFIDAM
ncbi:MAG: lysophospholipid acyltransferase family protein [Myxococcota bacterium]|nr:lysophospholipid acyltransferase family protein [Myxococcota bacterium]